MKIKLKGQLRENIPLYYESLEMVPRQVTPTWGGKEMESQIQDLSLNDVRSSDIKFQSTFKETTKNT